MQKATFKDLIEEQKQQIAGSFKTLHYVFRTRIGTIGLMVTVLLIGFIYSGLSYGTLNYDAELVKAMAALKTPAFAQILDNKELSVEALTQELAQFEQIFFVDYAVMLDAGGKAVATWRRHPGDTSYSYRYAAGLASGATTLNEHGMYNSFTFGKYRLVVGGSIKAVIARDINSMHYIFLLSLTVLIGALIGLLYVIFNKLVIMPLIFVTKSAAGILEARDLTNPIPITAKNEVNRIAYINNKIFGRLRNILLDLRETCQKFTAITGQLAISGADIADNSAVIRESIKNTQQTTDELMTSFNAVAAKLRDLSAESERGSTTVYEMSQVNQEVFDNVTAMSSAVT